MKRYISFLILFGTGLLWSCDDAYFADGGPLDEQVATLNMSTMSYLESHPERFDTLATLIRICGLEAEINKSGNTFLAPQDYSIHNYFKLIFPEGPWPPLSQLTDEQKADIAGILKNYIVPDKQVVRSELTSAYSFTTTSGGKRARFNLVREDYLGNVNMGAAYIVFSLDVSPPSSPREIYQSVFVATSGLRSTNGIVHVLVPDTHIFGFN